MSRPGIPNIALAASLLALALALGVSCRQLIGIDVSDAASGAASVIPTAGTAGRAGNPWPVASPEECKSYCAAVMDACQGTNAVYVSTEHCLGVCANLEAGDPLEPGGNTLACRAHQAKAAKFEPDINCRSAGPGGGDQCGSDCDAYCDLFPKLCPEAYIYKTTASCLKACKGLTDLDRFNLLADHNGDTIECRLVHVSNAALKPDEHCAHAPIIPAGPWCTGDGDASPTCDEYCNIELAACDGQFAQYESRQQCLDVCGAFELGRNDDEEGNTVGCRRHHAFSATLDPDLYCAHSGPTGDGHCGDHGSRADGHTGNCESYCAIVAAACPQQFEDVLGDADRCMAECIPLREAKPDSKYSLATVTTGLNPGLNCRVLHAARALSNPTACAAAVGGDPCR